MNNLDVLYDSNYNDRKKELDELWKSFKSQRSGNGIIRGSWRAKFGSRWKKGFETFGQHFVWQSLTANISEETKRRNLETLEDSGLVLLFPRFVPDLMIIFLFVELNLFRFSCLNQNFLFLKQQNGLGTVSAPPVSFGGTEFLGDRGVFNFSFSF